jgi:hypothetical protein
LSVAAACIPGDVSVYMLRVGVTSRCRVARSPPPETHAVPVRLSATTSWSSKRTRSRSSPEPHRHPGWLAVSDLPAPSRRWPPRVIELRGLTYASALDRPTVLDQKSRRP